MKISVIIPVCNRIQTLKDAIESVFQQTYKNIEIIVIDDGSKTDIEHYLKPYLSRIVLIKNNINRGVSFSRNLGIKISSGEYIALLDSDDIWLNFKLEFQLKNMVKANSLVCHTDEFWYRQGKFVNQGEKHKKYGGKILTKILDICRISPSSILFHKSIFSTTGLFNQYLKVCEDYDLWLRIALFYEILYIPTKTIVKRAITNDQLSLNTPYMESIRLKSLISFLKRYHKLLTVEEKIAVIEEVKRKENIVRRYRFKDK
ncbi:glycosyltransferase family 2 protein [Deferribacterales bacterium Es71-Z0220]|uniref:glycosyltransferase family 2 protein n=1 Tax=Deferrivibrio essentukiensis TaxID=2880922 RepID=UPI001F61852B|nr:glycosyltransferase family A protein [Deferrivibrio essentukiensis]MCB4204366.1 glycosyltransferase family 2 protein [Deferrivibrio essentukiensis]